MTKEKYQMSRTIIHLYQKLADLEKQNKKDTNEYRNLVSLLPLCVQIEKQELEQQTYLEEEDEKLNAYLDTQLESMSGYFKMIPENFLLLLRVFEHKDQDFENTIYNMDDNISVNLQENLMTEIIKCLKSNMLTPVQRNYLIDYQYMLLSYMPNLEEKILFNDPMMAYSFYEIPLSDLYELVLPTLEDVTKYLLSLTDNTMKNETIILILYIKVLLKILPDDLRKEKLEEMKKTIGVNLVLSYTSGTNRHKLYEIIFNILELKTPTKTLK